MVAGTRSPNQVRESGKNHINRGGEEIEPGTLHGGEEIEPGTLHGGEEIEPGTLHGGEEIEPGTLHGGEEICVGGVLCANESIEGGALCASFTPGTYRTKDGSSLYKFRYVDNGGRFEIDILEQPSYNGKIYSAGYSHILPSARGGSKICISGGYEPKSIDKARKISAEWAELTHVSKTQGISIDDQVRRISKENKKTERSKRSGFLNWLFN